MRAGARAGIEPARAIGTRLTPIRRLGRGDRDEKHRVGVLVDAPVDVLDGAPDAPIADELDGVLADQLNADRHPAEEVPGVAETALGRLRIQPVIPFQTGDRMYLHHVRRANIGDCHCLTLSFRPVHPNIGRVNVYFSI